jgi:hypothetical protein
VIIGSSIQERAERCNYTGEEVMLTDFGGTVVLVTLIVVCVGTVTSVLPVAQTPRLLLTMAAGLWVGLQMALANAGAFSDGPSAVPLLGMMVALPPLAVLGTAMSSQGVRDALLGLPTRLLVGLNIGRALGFYFLLLATEGRLGGPFPQSAGWGDVVTGMGALLLTIALARTRKNRTLLAAWNAFGFVDLIAAVSFGVLSANNFPFHLIQSAAGSAAIQALPWSLIPTVLVPFYLTIHGVIFAQLRAPAGNPAMLRSAA